MTYNWPIKRTALFLLPVLLTACGLLGTPAAPDAGVDPTAVAPTAPAATSIPTAIPSLPPETSILPVFTSFPPPEIGAVVMDGVFDDWDAFSLLFADPSGDARPSGVDLTGIYAAHTDTHLLFRVDLGLEINLLPGHTHTNFTSTWRDDESSFAPGRLDFVIYTDSVLNMRGFVLNTAEMLADELAAYGLQAEDTAGSDHLPLVADVVIVAVP